MFVGKSKKKKVEIPFHNIIGNVPTTIILVEYKIIIQKLSMPSNIYIYVHIVLTLQNIWAGYR